MTSVFKTRKSRGTKVTACVLALALVLLTLWLRLLIGARLDGPGLIIFTIPVIISAYVGGFGPGLLATGGAFLGASYYLLAPLHSLTVASTASRWHQVIMVFACVLISAICEGLRQARDRAETSQDALRESEEHFRFLNDLTEATRPLVDPAQIMAVMARMLGEHLRASRCAYADVEPDGEQFTILHDYTDGCVSTVGHYRLSLFGPRAVATLQLGQTLIIRNVEQELLPAEGADMFQAIGIKAIITCPLVKEGVLRAMMAVHQTIPREWQLAEIAVVEDVVERCWATIERRAAAAEVRQLNIVLEQRVTERTAQLEAANRELEAFSYSVSHDLRAPLRAVDGFSQAVIEDFGPQLPADGQRMLKTIRQSAQRMGQLIDDLLAFSRLSRQPLTKQEVLMGPLVREAIAELHASAKGRQVELVIGEFPPCFGERALLRQVWINLLSNALKYTRKCAQARVEIGWQEQDGEPVFFIKDNGSGFDMHYAHKLFGVFQRLHRAEDFEGTGVGLAIVQRIIHRHGGRIWAEAAVDRGATFYFTIPGETQS